MNNQASHIIPNSKRNQHQANNKYFHNPMQSTNITNNPANNPATNPKKQTKHKTKYTYNRSNNQE